jgi:hypothetical protein
MAIFAFYPASPALRRADGIGFAMAEGADVASARSVAQALIGGASTTISPLSRLRRASRPWPFRDCLSAPGCRPSGRT